MTTTTRTHDLHPLLADRRSPRSFDPSHQLADSAVVGLLEAARWAPSSMNRQPWRFVVARRAAPGHAEVMGALMPGNRLWAGDASALVVGLAERAPDGASQPTAHYDLGLAIAQLTVQAHALDLHVHQMGGFDAGTLRGALSLPAEVEPVVVVAVGRRDAPERLPADLRAREVAPRVRRPLDETVLSVDGRTWPGKSEGAAVAA